MPKLRALISQSETPGGVELKNWGDLSVEQVILSDEGDSLSSPKRIVDLLQSIDKIYRTIADIEGLPGDSIAVVAMDSGSEKSFDFLGLAKIMTELRGLFQDVYNIVAFHKQNVNIKNLQLASETIGVIARIGELEKRGSITNEDAGRLRHNLYSGLEEFASTGAYSDAMRVDELPPSLAMRPQPQLLTGPSSQLILEANETENIEANETENIEVVGEGVEASEDSNEEEYTDEDIRAALSMLRQAKAQRSSESVLGQGSQPDEQEQTQSRPTKSRRSPRTSKVPRKSN